MNCEHGLPSLYAPPRLPSKKLRQDNFSDEALQTTSINKNLNSEPPPRFLIITHWDNGKNISKESSFLINKIISEILLEKLIILKKLAMAPFWLKESMVNTVNDFV